MEKETIIAKSKLLMKYSNRTLKWLSKYRENSNIFFAYKDGAQFFGEFGHTWDSILLETAQPIIDKYFLSLGIQREKLPKIKIFEHYSGSWIVDAAIVMAGTVGTTYKLLKGVSELPKIADGLIDLKGRIRKAVFKKSSLKVHDLLAEQSARFELPPPPKQPIDIDFTIDARPLLSLTSSVMRYHKIFLNVGISTGALTIENLGDEIIKDIRIGIFKSKEKMNQWNYADSFMGSIDILSPHQTISKAIDCFEKVNSERLDLDDLPLNVYCWIQDNFGIYLFMFYLDS